MIFQIDIHKVYDHNVECRSNLFTTCDAVTWILLHAQSHVESIFEPREVYKDSSNIENKFR